MKGISLNGLATMDSDVLEDVQNNIEGFLTGNLSRVEFGKGLIKKCKRCVFYRTTGTMYSGMDGECFGDSKQINKIVNDEVIPTDCPWIQKLKRLDDD